jgi:hypothetical protein
MAEHIDIMKSEPTSSMEYRLACVMLEGGRIEVDAPDSGYWRQLLRNVVQIDPDERPEEFFAALHERVDGTYVYATEPHDEARCAVAASAAAAASLGAPRGVAAGA